jgi:hypothetical protein
MKQSQQELQQTIQRQMLLGQQQLQLMVPWMTEQRRKHQRQQQRKCQQRLQQATLHLLVLGLHQLMESRLTEVT